MKNEQVLLARRPRGLVEEDDFRIVETEVPPIREGQLLTRVHYLSLDPYMRVGMAGWQQFQVTGGGGLRKIDIKVIPPSAYLGCVGMPGVTAWYGLTQIGKPKQGETVVVSAAAGAVGSVVGQLAKLRDCRAVGIAGGKTKCDLVTSELGFDACVDYKAESFKADF